MALFKIEKGLAANLTANRPNSIEGYCYFTSDDGKFYIDIANGTAITPADNQGELKGVTRMPINAYLSDKAKTADWAARSLADINGNEIDSHYGNSLEITDTYNLKLFAHDANKTLLSTVTLPKNVDTASKFTSKQTIKLTGAVTGEHSSQAGWEISTTLADNVVTTAKINNAAVTNAKIANGAVSNGKIANATIQNEKLVNSSITIGGKTVNLGGSLTLADMGLSSALRFIGQTTTAIVDGGTTSPISINGSNVTPTIGDVVINSNNNQEYVWLGAKWELLGDESSYALKDHTHKYAGSSSVGGAANSANKLNTNAGSTTRPVYFESGIPKACVDKFVFYEFVGDSSGIDTSTLFVEKKGDVMTGNLTAPKFIGPLQGNADTATALTSSAGSATQPIYFENGKPKNTTYTLAKSVPSDAKFTDTVYTHPTTSGNKHIPSGGSSGQILRWSADGTAVWGNDNNTTYESMSVAEGTTGTATTSRVLTAANLKGIINAHAPTKTGSGASGTWGISITGNAATSTTASSCSGNAATATKLATAQTISLTGDVTGSASFTGDSACTITATVADNSHNHTNYLPIAGGTMNDQAWIAWPDTGNWSNSNAGVTFPVQHGGLKWTGQSDWIKIFSEESASDMLDMIMQFGDDGSSALKIRHSNGTDAIKLSATGRIDASAVYGAVWNDYAEFRAQKEIIEPGYCVASADNGQVYKTTEKFQACDGIVSDTFGFSIGETEECQTPLAVAGRVLAYFHGNRADYHSGDTVCAGPEGKVIKMTREEIREWPDRIVGIVSEIPEYEIWGSGNVKVNNRIWIKIK